MTFDVLIVVDTSTIVNMTNAAHTPVFGDVLEADDAVGTAELLAALANPMNLSPRVPELV